MTVPESIALFLGTVSVLAADGTWAWKQVFGVPGASFLVCGVALVGFPIFGDIQVKAPGIEISLDQRLEKALKEDPKVALATIDHSVSLVIDDTLDGNTTSSSAQLAATRQQLQVWRLQNEELSNLYMTLHDQAMTPITNLR